MEPNSVPCGAGSLNSTHIEIDDHMSELSRRTIRLKLNKPRVNLSDTHRTNGVDLAHHATKSIDVVNQAFVAIQAFPAPSDTQSLYRSCTQNLSRMTSCGTDRSDDSMSRHLVADDNMTPKVVSIHGDGDLGDNSKTNEMMAAHGDVVPRLRMPPPAAHISPTARTHASTRSYMSPTARQNSTFSPATMRSNLSRPGSYCWPNTSRTQYEQNTGVNEDQVYHHLALHQKIVQDRSDKGDAPIVEYDLDSGAFSTTVVSTTRFPSPETFDIE